MPIIHAGIDYSITSPSICVGDIENGVDFNKCKLYYLSNKKKLYNNGIIEGTLYPRYTADPERYHNLAEWTMGILKKHAVEAVYIEGYAFNAVGRVFQIAENAGLLKYKLWNERIRTVVLAPTSIKKFASGKGNANKQLMWESFLKETNINIMKMMDYADDAEVGNPVNDMVDAYYALKCGVGLTL